MNQGHLAAEHMHSASSGKITTASSQAGHVRRSLRPSIRSATSVAQHLKCRADMLAISGRDEHANVSACPLAAASRAPICRSLAV
jgi:hypothetical protein